MEGPTPVGGRRRALAWPPCREPSPQGSAGEPPPPPTRSRAATSTTTGGRGSRRRVRAASSPAATPATSTTATRPTSRCWPALGFDSYRFSIEWSRIEPEEGQFSAAALDHYRRVCAACLEHGLEPTVTFHHFTTPRWATVDGGWSDPAIVDRFGRFCEKATGHLGDLIARACTINEPNIVSFMGYMGGVFPPGCRDRERWLAASDHFVAAHRRAVDVLGAGPGDFPVGLTVSMSDYQAVPADDPAAISRLERVRGHSEDVFLAGVPRRRLRGRAVLHAAPASGPTACSATRTASDVLIMGYEYWPQVAGRDDPPGLGGDRARADPRDRERHRHRRRRRSASATCAPRSRACSTASTTASTCAATPTGALLDNFEWAFGYRPRFGLVEVDRATQQRVVKPSGHWLGAIARANQLDD